MLCERGIQNYIYIIYMCTFFLKLEIFDDAKSYRDKFRPQKSAVYNVNRLTENPIPSLEPNICDARNSTEDVQANDLTLANDFPNDEMNSSHQNFEILSEESQLITEEIDNEIEAILHNDTSSIENHRTNISDDENFAEELDSRHATGFAVEAQDLANGETSSSHENNERSDEQSDEPSQLDVVETDAEVHRTIQNETPSESVDVKSSFSPVQMENDESVAIDGLFNTTNNVASSTDNSVDENGDVFVDSVSLRNVRLTANETAVINSKGQIEVTQIIDKDLACVYIYGECPVPLAPFYNIKMNDLITGNIPFKENVSFVTFFNDNIFILNRTIYILSKRNVKTERIWCESMAYLRKSSSVHS